ncbi:MAG: hypothetical protein WCB31_08830 [Nitrososphaeraceae archaeon]
MNNNSKLHKSSAMLMAAVLVAGVIAIASPSIAFAEDKKYEKQGWKYNKAECSVNNFNIGEVTEFEAQIFSSWLQQAENNSAASSDENMDPTVEAMDASFGIESNDVGMERNGGGGIELDLENICLNFGDNENFGTVGSVP